MILQLTAVNYYRLSYHCEFGMTVPRFIITIISIVAGLIMAAMMVVFSSTEAEESLKMEARWMGGGYIAEEETTSCEKFINWRKVSYRHGATYSTKTGYLFEKDVIDESRINNCSIVEVYAIYRHGTRTPVKKHISKYVQLQDVLKTFISHSSTLTQAVKLVKNWTNPFDTPTSEYLTVAGMKENYCLAKRIKKRFHQLFTRPYSPIWYSIHGTYKERTMQSANSFAHGLFEDQGPLNGYQPIVTTINDALLRFFEVCHRYGDIRGSNETVKEYINSFLDQPIVTDVRRSIQKKIDPRGELWNVTTKQIDAMYDLCALETAIYGKSVWCSLFTKKEKGVLEYKADLKHYVKRSYDHRLNWRVTCPVFDDILKYMANIVNGVPDTPRVHLRFAHAETLIPLVTALGLYKDKEPLRPTNYEAQIDRVFNTGSFCPFAGNLVFALYSCGSRNNGDKSDYRVRVLLNEKSISLNNSRCDDEDPFFCPYDQFKNILHETSLGEIVPCDFENVCSKDVY